MVLPDLLVHQLGDVLAGVVHHEDVVFTAVLPDEDLVEDDLAVLILHVDELELGALRERGLGDVGHEAQEVGTLEAHVKDLEGFHPVPGDGCHQ